MKKIVISSIFVILILTLCFCQRKMIDYAPVNYNKGEWVDEDTFRITGVGMPDVHSNSLLEKKKSACLAAIKNAQYRIFNKLFKLELSYYPKLQFEFNIDKLLQLKKKSIKLNRKSSIVFIIANGIVFKEVFDKNANCEVLFEIRAKGLKERFKSFTGE